MQITYFVLVEAQPKGCVFFALNLALNAALLGLLKAVRPMVAKPVPKYRFL